MRIMALNQSPMRPGIDRNRVEAQLRAYASPGTVIDLVYPDDFPGAAIFEQLGDQENALSGLHHALETPSLIRKTVWAQENGYDAVIQTNTFDPGVEAARMAVSIPVIGLLRSSLHVASIVAHRIGIMVPLDGHVARTRELLRMYGMESSVCGMRVLRRYGKSLESQREDLTAESVRVMRELVTEDGAEVILPLGAALIPKVVDPRTLEPQVGVPVLNTRWIGVRTAEMCVDLGMSQSPVAYPLAKVGSEAYDQLAFG